MQRFLQPPRIYFLYSVGFMAGSYGGMCLGVFLAGADRLRPSEQASLLSDPTEWGWLWLPSATASIVILAVIAILKRTLARYSKTARDTPVVMPGAACVLPFFVCLSSAWFMVSKLMAG